MSIQWGPTVNAELSGVKRRGDRSYEPRKKRRLNPEDSLPRNASTWDAADVVLWLRKHGFGSAVESFKKYEITGGSLFDLSESQVKELGVNKFSVKNFFRERSRLTRAVEPTEQSTTPGTWQNNIYNSSISEINQGRVEKNYFAGATPAPKHGFNNVFARSFKSGWRFESGVSIPGKGKVYGGMFGTPEEAAVASDRTAIKHQKTTGINFPKMWKTN